MFVFILLTIVFLNGTCQEIPVVQKDGHDVKITGIGETSLMIPSRLTLKMPKSCTGDLSMCYESETTRCQNEACDNFNEQKCPSGYCFFNFGVLTSTVYGMFDVKNDNENVVGAFMSMPNICPLKKGARQTFKVLELPQCDVSVIGASLPQNKEKQNDENTDKDEVEDAATTAKADIARWALPVGIVSIIVIFIAIALSSFGLYKCWKNKKFANVPKPEQMASPPKTVNVVSPHPNPTSPMATPAVSQLTTHVPTTPSTVPKPKLPVVAPNCEKLDGGPLKVAQVVTKEIKQEERPKPVQKARSVATLMTVDTCDTTEELGVFQLVEEHAESLNRYGQLRFKGVHPIESGTRLHPFLQVVYRKYRSTRRRQIEQYEIEFFASDVSAVFREAKWRLKDTRQVLCRHGAVYEHGRWKSFNASTYEYLVKASTPGFVVAYGFASEYGGDINLKVDNAKTRSVIRKLSAPALLTVFMRENLPAIVRRRAFARLRRLLPQIDRLVPDSQLRGMPYPLSIIPAMKEIDRHILKDAAKDTTLTPPLEKKKRSAENPVVVVIDELDETQVSDSDVDKDARSVDRSKAKSAPTLTEELKEMIFGSRSR